MEILKHLPSYLSKIDGEVMLFEANVDHTVTAEKEASLRDALSSSTDVVTGLMFCKRLKGFMLEKKNLLKFVSVWAVLQA